MPRAKLTDNAIRSFKLPASGQVTWWDSTLPRFGLRLSAGGSRAWVVAYKVRRRTRWLTLGTYPLVPLADARAKAKETLAAVVQGADPAGERRAEREAPTFEDLANEYMERHARPKKRSWKADERMLAKYVPRVWGAMPAQRSHGDTSVTCSTTSPPTRQSRPTACSRSYGRPGTSESSAISV